MVRPLTCKGHGSSSGISIKDLINGNVSDDNGGRFAVADAMMHSEVFYLVIYLDLCIWVRVCAYRRPYNNHTE